MKRTALNLLTAAAGLATGFAVQAAGSTAPITGPDLVFDEVDGIVAVEAEHFHKQTLTGKRAWHITSSKAAPDLKPDSDPPHLAGASGGAYLEILPDTRANHGHKLIEGDNFTDQPGVLTVAHYKVNINTPGRYYVWVRSFSTGSEDNGVHVGVDGQWPDSGQRWQTVNKKAWAWDCSQRTQTVHTGVPMQLFLDIRKTGVHEIMFSLRIVGESDGQSTYQVADEVTKAALEKHTAATPSKPGKPAGPALVQPRRPDGSGAVAISGELKQWHKVTLTLDGPFAHERDTQPNPFTDQALNVTFTHESGSPDYTVPGYFAADGNASESSAESGTKWRVHLSPDKAGKWSYAVSFTEGSQVALGGKGVPVKPFDGQAGSFTIGASDKTGRDFRAQGRLQYVGKHHLRFAGSKQYFLKAGPDAPETLLGYVDFDNTIANKGKKAPLKTWKPHAGDWKPGDPTWRDGKGKGLIGALNYLSGKGVNAFSFLTYNASGDGDNVWPFVDRDSKLHYDCSKLDQWGIVFDHATARGLYLHFKLQENEMDDNRRGMEYYSGYKLPENDLPCEDFRARDRSWDYCRIALDFFRDNRIPFWEMKNANTLIGNTKNDNSGYCFAKDGGLYLVYLPEGGECQIDLGGVSGKFSLKWFNPREGGLPTAIGSAALAGGSKETLTAPTAEDWLAVIAREL